MQKRQSTLALLGFGAAVAGAAWYASRYNPKDPDTRRWYRSLDKPSYNPPQYVFPIVWTSLYALIAYSGWRTWQAERSPERSQALRLWVSQLAANADWTKLFFGKRSPKRALADVLLLESLIIRYMVSANKVDRAAALSFVPYAAWVAFAAHLNAEIARRNPDRERKFSKRVA